MTTGTLVGRGVFARRCTRLASLLFLTAMAMPCGAQVLAPSSGGVRLVGSVRDSIRKGPLADARVELVPATARDAARYRAVTDATGAFAFDSVAPGRYLIGFKHARLDSLGIDPPTRMIDVSDAAAQPVLALAVPSAQSVAAALCGELFENAGLLLGRLLAADDASPVRQATVHARWVELVVDSGRLKRETHEARSGVGETGRYVLCGLPTNVTVLVSVGDDAESDGEPSGRDDGARASVPSAWSGTLELSVDGATRASYRDIVVTTEARFPDARAGGAIDSLAGAPNPAKRTTRTAMLIGRIGRPDGSPVRGARVRIRSSQDTAATSTVREAITGDDGRYLLEGLPSGTQPVEVIALGYSPIRGIVDLRPRRAATFDAIVATLATVLDAVTVSATPPIRAGHEFAIRRATDRRATFLTASDIARRSPMSTSFALSAVNGLRLVSERGRLQLGGRGNCSPKVFLDGFQLSGVDEIDTAIRPTELGGVEVHDDSYSAPPRYGMAPPPSPCQVILLWSKALLR